MNTEKKWHAVYTRPRWEKKVAELLTKKNIEVYCPLNRVQHQWADRKKTVHQPLFTSYVFVRTHEAGHLAIRQTEGILNFVYWLGKPALIRDEEIAAIQHFLHEHEAVKLEKIQVNVADKIRIIDGPLIYREGNVVEVQSKSVKVCLPSLGYALVAEVRKGSIEIIQTHRANSRITIA